MVYCSIVIFSMPKLSWHNVLNKKIPSFLGKNFKKQKNPPVNAKGLEISWLSRQGDFHNFCLNNDAEKVFQKLKEMIFINKSLASPMSNLIIWGSFKNTLNANSLSLVKTAFNSRSYGVYN